MFRKHAKAAKLPPIRMHDLRHTHATLLLQAGVHPKIVSERLGHHSVAFTLDTYAHVLRGMQAEAAEDLADRILEAVGEADDEDDEDDEDEAEPFGPVSGGGLSRQEAPLTSRFAPRRGTSGHHQTPVVTARCDLDVNSAGGRR